jgi:hypothetical protein
MIVKPSISFLNSDRDAQLLVRTDGIRVAMTDNPSYPAPVPTIPEVTQGRDEFDDALAKSLEGGKEATANKNAKRAALVALLRRLANYVQVTCGGDLTVLLSSGFPIQKPQRQPIGVLPPPSNLTVTFGARSGELQATANSGAGAAIFNWRLSTAAAPDVVVQTVQTTARRCTFANLTPGVTYNIQANVVGAAGPSSWSEPVPHIVA